MSQPKTPTNPNGSRGRRVWARVLALVVTLTFILAACSNESAAPQTGPTPTPTAPTTPAKQPWNPDVLLHRGPFYSLPLDKGYIPDGEVQPWVMPMAAGNEVEMKALLISATDNENEREASAGAWIAILEQAGVPYDWFVATENTLTIDDLVRPDGVGKYQAILLSTSNLVYNAGGSFPSAFDEGEWQLLFNYELAYGVRQATLYGSPYSAPEPYGLGDFGGGAVDLEDVIVTPTAAGLEIFTDLNSDSVIEVYGTEGFPSRDPVAGTTPLLMLGSEIVAVHIDNGGRERVAMLYNNPAWGERNTPANYTQQIGPSLLRWAMGGVHIGERRASYQADVDDWFNSTGLWNLELGHDDPDEEFEMSAQDALSLVAQQAALRQIGNGIASGFTWSMAYNGQPADPTSVVDCSLPANQHTLSSMTRCLAGEFWWVNHTWSHAYMDWNPPHVGLNHDQIVAEISQADDVSTAFGFGSNDSRRSLVTGDISGLGWYTPEGPDKGPKVDHGLQGSSPYLLSALVETGRSYLASNMSTPSHEPTCWGCGMVHPMNEAIFLVPRWPTNLFATVATPEHVVQAYNQIYGPGGITPLPGIVEPLTYEQILDIDTDVAIGHLLSGSPYPHYFHISNFYEYAPGRSLLFDWTSVLLTKYAQYMNEPLLSYKNDAFGDYVRARTEFLDNDVTGVWDRVTGQISITSASGGPVFFTGASLGAGSTTIEYNGRLISVRNFDPGETVTINIDGIPPVAPAIQSFSADPVLVAPGSPATLSWSVTGDYDNIALRVFGGSELGTSLARMGSHVVNPAEVTTYELVVSVAGSPDLVSQVTVSMATAPSLSLAAAPTTITAGESTTLTWNVTGDHNDVSLRTEGPEGTTIASGLAATDTRVESPSSTTTYRLVATWLGGEVLSDPVTVTVNPAPVQPAATFTASPDTIVAGASSTLAWAVTGDSTNRYIRLQGATEPAYADLTVEGELTVSPTTTTTYELVMEWAGQPVVQPVTVTVTPAPVQPAITFAANPDTIVAGASSTLAWNVTGSVTNTLLRVKDGAAVATDLPANGTQGVTPATTTTYELVATWANGEVVAETTVTVTPAPVQPNITFAAEPGTVVAGNSSQLSWNVTGSVTNTLLRVKGGATLGTELPANGTRNVTPTATTTYELVATWANGQVVAESTVTVTPAPDPEPEPEPTTHQVAITVSGEGFGIIITSPEGVVCLDECTAEFEEGTVLTLAPLPLLGSSFTGFSGACEGPVCSVTVTRDLHIGAVFGFED